MFDILFARTFVIVGCMLIITSVTAKKNKAFETASEMWISIISSFACLFAVMIFDDIFPLNIFLVACFSAIIGWQIGPAIEYFATKFKMRKYLNSKGIKLKKGQHITDQQKAEFHKSFDIKKYHSEWQNVIFQAISSTAIAVFCTAGMVFLTSIDYSFLGGFLSIALIMLIVMGLVNIFFLKSNILSLVRAYIGAIIFTLYLLYDFNRLEKMQGDESWETAISIAVNLYLDIINLFLKILEILSESN